MLNIYEKFHLGLFGEGEGAGEGDAGGETEAGDEIPSSIPARARETYKKALSKTRNREPQNVEVPTEETVVEEAPTHVPYADLIKSDEYKEEHKAYMDKTISDRLKRYKGIEDTVGRQSELLSLVAQKYGLDSHSETFLDDLKGKIEEDDSYYEQYAMENDMSVQDARKVVSLERKIKAQEEREAIRQAEEQKRANLQILMQNCDKCKSVYPNFDFDTERQNPKFMQLVAQLGGDVTTAYRITHWSELQNHTVQTVSQKVAQQTAAAVKANRARPLENGLQGSVASQQVAQDFSKMNLAQLREWASEQRRKRR